MRSVIKWMVENAALYTESKLHVTAEQAQREGLIVQAPMLSNRGFADGAMLVEFGCDRVVIAISELDQDIQNLRWLAGNYHNLNGAQLAEVMTTAHFSAYFTDALKRAFYTAYAFRTGTWRSYTFADTTPDFREVKRFRLEARQNMQKRREKAPPTETNLVLSDINYGVEEYAQAMDVSWRVIMNDDLGEIRRIPQMLAQTTREWEDEFVSDLYDNSTTQTALVALGSVYSGTGRLTEANLAVGLNAMFRRTDSTGRQMNIRSVTLVIPPISEITARKILESTQIAGSANNDVNVVPRYVSSFAIDPYIDVSGGTPWYLVADPAAIPGITVARLQGWSEPVVVMKRSNMEVISGSAPAAFLMGDYATGDIEYQVVDVIGGWDDSSYVGVTDYRGIYYSSGTTA